MRAIRCTLSAAFCLGLSTLPAFAHHGSAEIERQFTAQYSFKDLSVSDERTLDAMKQLVQLAGKIQGEWHQPLFPAETTVDSARWDGRVLHIDLTIPKDVADWKLSCIDLESLSRAFNKPFQYDDRFGGVDFRVRRDGDADYGNIQQFSPLPTSIGDRPDPLHALEIIEPLDRAVEPLIVDRNGPTTSAGRQPTGALSGVTVFISAGHGWTAGSENWFLQRPLLLGMCEDYGNIDQLNYFAAYLFNAGATVVPLRPVGWQPIEIVLDNDDPGVTFTGAWQNGSSSKYFENGVTNSGIVYKFISAAGVESAVARYTPTITQTDFYPVYCFTIHSSNRSLQTYRVSHSGGISEIAIDHRNVGNGWIWLGDYHLNAGGDNWVEITNQSSVAGAIVADAIRWGGGTGDIVRPGPGVISGYPRDEECQRMWGESEWGNNAVGFDSTLWDSPGSADDSDNVGTGARLAAEMNLVPAGGIASERWKRCHVEFHTNAFDTSARGQVSLITNTGSTTNQTSFATIMSNEVDQDMGIIQSDLEHPWFDRAGATLIGAYGAISTPNNGNEFDATLVELAFHDNQQDAEILRSPSTRRSMGRSCAQGVVRFLNSLAGSTVPLAFSPDTPRSVRVEDLATGSVRLTWQAPVSDGARGDAATGYVIYQSSNGYGFGNPIIVGNVTTTDISGIAAGETRYFRIAATNTGGESMPSEVIAIRRKSDGSAANLLIVNGFDRLRRQQNFVQRFTQPPFYANGTTERQVWRLNNSFDYVIEHATSLAALDIGFATTSNEPFGAGSVSLTPYTIIDWIGGNESVEEETLSTAEQTRLTTFMTAGGDLFMSGSDVAFDLINQSGGAAFANNTLRLNYVGNDADSYDVTPTGNGIFAGMAPFDFDPTTGAPYDAFSPDIIGARTGSRAALTYVGGVGGTAAVQYSSGVFNVVTLAFPFETIGDPDVRNDVMARAINYLRTATGPNQFDFDGDGDVDASDANVFYFCFQGPLTTFPSGNFCRRFDTNADADCDLGDFMMLQVNFTGPLAP
ncbi:MAG: fibronectin type III domain-containing protein [Phycisphaerae bacterium]